MSVCSPCTKVDVIPVCLTNLIIGTIAGLTQNVWIYFRDTTTGKLKRYENQSDGAGLVTLTLVQNNGDFMPEHAYEVWVQNENEVNIETKLDITISAVIYTCFLVNFTYVKDGDETNETYTTVTITPTT